MKNTIAITAAPPFRATITVGAMFLIELDHVLRVAFGIASARARHLGRPS